MHPLTRTQQRQHPRRHAAFPVALHDDEQREDVEPAKEILREVDLLAAVRELVQEVVDVNVHGGIDEGPCGARDFGIVVLAGEIGVNLLHVGFPIDFGVWFKAS